MTAAILLIYLLTGNVVGSSILKKNKAEYLPLTICISIFVLYGFGLFNSLLWGVYILFAISCILYIISFLNLFCTRSWKSFAKELKKDYMVFYLIAYAAIIVCNYQIQVTIYDDLEHWGLSVKEMCRYNTFTLRPDSYVWGQAYPPAMPLFQYFVQQLGLKLLGMSEFSEWLLFVTYHATLYAFLLPAYDLIKKQNAGQKIMVGILLFLLPHIILCEGYTFSSIYIDLFLSILAVSGILAMYEDDGNNLCKMLYFSCVVIMLTLTKDTGLIFAGMFSVFYTAKGLRSRKIWVLLPVLFCVLTKVSWSAKVTFEGVANRATSLATLGINLSEVPGEIIKSQDTYRHKTLVNYCHAFFDEEKVQIGNMSITMSFCTLSILLLIITIILLKKSKKEEIFIHIVIFSTVIVYMLALCVFYMYIFSESEAVGLAAYSRYVGTIFNFWVVLIAIFGLRHISIWMETDRRKVLICQLLLLACLPLGNWFCYFDRTFKGKSRTYREQFKEDVSIIRNNVSEDQKIYLINTKGTEMDRTMCYLTIFFECYDIPHATNYIDIVNESTPEAWREVVFSDYDFVYLRAIDEGFINEYEHCFEDALTLEEKQLYYVDKDSNRFVRVLNGER